MSTKCKSCKREVPDNATFCPWCGQKQVRERKKDGVIKVPEPKQLPSGNWRIYLAAEKQSVTEATKDRCIAKAKAIRAGFAFPFRCLMLAHFECPDMTMQLLCQ